MNFEYSRVQKGHTSTKRVIWLSPQEKSNLAAARKEKLSGGRKRKRVIWLPPEELSGDQQKSYEGQ